METGVPAWAYLTYLCRTALREKYPHAPERVWQQLQYELDVIEAGGLANYFLVVWDIVHFAREQGIRCQGRGSAANSLVAYLLDVSPIDPLAHDLVFERFLSDERRVVPDIDIDFDATRREEVIRYVYDRYGEEHAAMACTFVTFRARSALRDVGKALGVPAESKDSETAIETLREAFLAGAQDNGVSPKTAEQVFDQLKAFGSYSFAKSHAAAFAVIVYQAAWLKRYYPAAFFCALLNNQPMGFWQPSVLVGDAKRHGVEMLPADVNASEGACTLEVSVERSSGTCEHAIRIGLRYVDGMGDAAIQQLTAAREQGTFTGLRDLCRRTRLPKRLVENLIVAGALDAWDIPRRRLLWKLGTLQYREDALDLDSPDDDVSLPALTPGESLALEYEVLGLSTREHVMTLHREQLRARGIRSSADLEQCADG